MKIAIIGTSSYQEKMNEHKQKLEKLGHEVRLPAFDSGPKRELDILKFNRDLVEWADEINIFWDQRSMGTIFDFGMAFMARKRIEIIYLEPKTLANAMRQYAAEGWTLE